MLIAVTFSSSTVVFAVTEASPFLTVTVYSPVVSLAVATNVTAVLPSFHVSFKSTLLVPFVTSAVTAAGCALSNSTTKVSALVALKLVIAPSI